MKNCKKCRNLLKKQLFVSLLATFTEKIIKKFSNEIDVNFFVKVLEENMKLILQLAAEENITINDTYLIEKNVPQFELKYKKYIEIIKEKINTGPNS